MKYKINFNVYSKSVTGLMRSLEKTGDRYEIVCNYKDESDLILYRDIEIDSSNVNYKSIEDPSIFEDDISKIFPIITLIGKFKFNLNSKVSNSMYLPTFIDNYSLFYYSDNVKDFTISSIEDKFNVKIEMIQE